MRACLLLVDALNLIRRVHAAQPDEDTAQKAEDARTATVQSLRRALREVSPTHAVAVFEGEGPSFRHALHPPYKTGRKPMPGTLAQALPAFRESFLDLGVASYSLPATEADDVIGTFARKAENADVTAVILSTDKAFLQLLSDRIRVRDHFNQKELDAGYVRQKFGVGPGQLVDYLALVGDPQNHIPGVAGVGAKTAAALIDEHERLDTVLDRAATMSGSVRTKLLEGADAARLSRSLLQLKCDLSLGRNLRDFRYDP